MVTDAHPLPAAPLVSTTRPLTDRSPSPWGFRIGLALLALATGALTVWAIDSASESQYYAAIAVSMSQSPANFFFGAFDPAGTVTLDKIPGSFWVPALFVAAFGDSTWTVVLPNALAALATVVVVASTGRRLVSPTAGLIAGAVAATTPILIAVSRSNQPETFFVLSLSLVAWAAARALIQRSLGWLITAGLFIGLAFQMYMLVAWAVWPALALAYLITAQPVIRRLWHLAASATISIAASLTWIVIVSLIPADSRPYIGSTLSNNPWEMVFGYNGLGRFSATADSSEYLSFSPPFSGDPSAVRLFTEQLAGQIAWLLPAALLAASVLWMLRFSRAVTVFLGAWLVIFAAMFSAVDGMHQFYTAALAVPVALLVGLAFGVARRRGILWPQVSLIVVAGVTAVLISLWYPGYSTVVSVIQAAVGALAIVLLFAVHARDPPRSSRIVKLHAPVSIRGVGPADSTGKSVVRYCPGGNRSFVSRRRAPKPRDTGDMGVLRSTTDAGILRILRDLRKSATRVGRRMSRLGSGGSRRAPVDPRGVSMAERTDPRVAVYLDFDNIVMSWYDTVHGRNAYGRDRQRIASDPTEPEIAERLAAATVDLGAIIDYAASFGTLVLTRAYADWSSPVNAEYRSQLVARAVDLVQLFPAAAYAKNGADIRLAVDTVEDMFRLPDLSHVVIVAGDSDYVPLAQRCKRLGRFVVGVGVAGSSARSLAAACDRFDTYDALPGIERQPAKDAEDKASGKTRRSRKKSADPGAELLERALRLEGDREGTDWQHANVVKSLITRLDPGFSERALGFRSFTEFIKAHPQVAEIDETENIVQIRLAAGTR